MNNTLKKLVKSENKRLLYFTAILIISLVISALIYILAGSEAIKSVSYEDISNMLFMEIFVMTLKRNLIYFIAIIFFTCMGQGKIINLLFILISIYFGLSVIYFIRTLNMDVKYFVLNFTDYLVFFPILFYFTFVSSTISKYTKKTKNIETISHKFDIIVNSYIKLSLIYILFVVCYSFVYSHYILILSRLLVR